MKKQIINYLVLIVIALVANYPVYRDLQASVEVARISFKLILNSTSYSLLRLFNVVFNVDDFFISL